MYRSKGGQGADWRLTTLTTTSKIPPTSRSTASLPSTRTATPNGLSASRGSTPALLAVPPLHPLEPVDHFPPPVHGWEPAYEIPAERASATGARPDEADGALRCASLESMTSSIPPQRSGRAAELLAPLGARRAPPVSQLGLPYLEQQQLLMKRNKSLELATRRLGAELARIKEGEHERCVELTHHTHEP